MSTKKVLPSVNGIEDESAITILSEETVLTGNI